jgi:hypothetical protein
LNNNQNEEIEFWPIIFITAIGIAVGMIQIDPKMAYFTTLLALLFLNTYLFDKKTKNIQELIEKADQIRKIVILITILLFSLLFLMLLPIKFIIAVLVIVFIAAAIFWILVLSGEDRNKKRIKTLENTLNKIVLTIGILWFVPLNLVIAVLAIMLLLALTARIILIYKFEV